MPLFCCNQGRHANECVPCIFIYWYSFGKELQMQQETTQYRTAQQDRSGNRGWLRNTIRAIAQTIQQQRISVLTAQKGHNACTKRTDTAASVHRKRLPSRTRRSNLPECHACGTLGKPGLCAHAYACARMKNITFQLVCLTTHLWIL